MRSRTASLLRLVLGATFAGLFLCHAADAQICNVTVDEDGNGICTLGPGFLAPDPGPGGLPSVLTYEDGATGIQGFTYHFISDGTLAIPEPSSTALFSLGLLVLVLGVGQRRRTSART